MKSFLPILFLFLCIVSCNKDKKTQKEIDAIVANGTWKIESLIRDSVDITGNYLEYNLTFNKDGSAIAITDTTTNSGKWSVDVASVLDNPRTDRFRLFIKLTYDYQNELEHLNEWWHIKSHEEQLLQLFSGDEDGRYVLILKKN